MDPGIVVRRATAADAHGIAVVHVRAWREAYAHLIPAEALAKLSVAQRELRWLDKISDPSPQVWVAEAHGDADAAVIGWATSSRGHVSGAPRDLELEGLYILASHYGSGAGQALLEVAIGDAPAFVWVATDNPRARSFYARNRFVSDGAIDMHSLAGTPVEAIRLVR